VILAVLAASCVPDRDVAIVNEDCREQMSAKVYRHACQHSALGPFEEAEAVAVRDQPAPLMGDPHRVLSIRIPPREVDPDGTSYVRYAASRGGPHAVLIGASYHAAAIAMWRGANRLRATPIEPVANPETCGGMIEVAGYDLSAGAEYRLELGPTSAPEIRIFLEHLPTFGETWSDRCVD
jgi:hypothetical protein